MSEPKSTISNVLRDLQLNGETILDVIQGVTEDGVPRARIEFAQGVVPPVEREIERAQARNHCFHSLKTFCDYVVRECDQEHCLILADVERAQIVATLDESSDRDREFVSFAAEIHPLVKPWLLQIGKAIGVSQFAMFVMQYRSAIAAPDGREIALQFSQVKASKQTTKQVGMGKNALNGVMVQLQIGSEKHDVPVELPERITINVPLFLDTDPIDIHFDLLVTESDEGRLVVYMTAPELDETRYNAFAAMTRQVARDTELMVGLGRVIERNWNLVERND